MFEAEPGNSIYHTTLKAVLYCNENNRKDVQFYFNDILLTVSNDSNPTDICEIYSLKHQLRQISRD